MRWTEDRLIRFCVLFVSMHCADKKMRDKAQRLLTLLTIRKIKP